MIISMGVLCWFVGFALPMWIGCGRKVKVFPICKTISLRLPGWLDVLFGTKESKLKKEWLQSVDILWSRWVQIDLKYFFYEWIFFVIFLSPAGPTSCVPRPGRLPQVPLFECWVFRVRCMKRPMGWEIERLKHTPFLNSTDTLHLFQTGEKNEDLLC